MKIIFGLLCSIGVAFAVTPDWVYFKFRYSKFYVNEQEDDLRMKIFLGNQKKIKDHNEQHTDYQLEMNRFGDFTEQEFKVRFNGLLEPSELKKDRKHDIRQDYDIPSDVNWRGWSIVGEVQDEELCKASWAFAAIGSLGSQTRIRTRQVIQLSAQNIIDCSTETGNRGCDGGSIEDTFEFILNNKGVADYGSYPYIGKKGVCKNTNHAISMTNYTWIKPNEEELKLAVATIGPVAVSIDAGHFSFQFYNGGNYFEPACNASDLNRSMLVVGYGSNSRGDYWLLQNSLGREWGEQGYMRLARNKNNHCGIVSKAFVPFVPYPMKE